MSHYSHNEMYFNNALIKTPPPETFPFTGTEIPNIINYKSFAKFYTE